MTTLASNFHTIVSGDPMEIINRGLCDQLISEYKQQLSEKSLANEKESTHTVSVKQKSLDLAEKLVTQGCWIALVICSIGYFGFSNKSSSSNWIFTNRYLQTVQTIGPRSHCTNMIQTQQRTQKDLFGNSCQAVTIKQVPISSYPLTVLCMSDLDTMFENVPVPYRQRMVRYYQSNPAVFMNEDYLISRYPPSATNRRIFGETNSDVFRY